MARIYVASSWRNAHQPAVVEALRKHGHEVYDFRNPFNGVPGFAWSEIDPNWQAWSAAEYRRLLTTDPIAARGFISDLRGMQWADTCVLVLPCGRSAHLEAGWFCGQGKRTIILTRDGEEPELMALLATDICIDLGEVLNLLAPRAGQLSAPTAHAPEVFNIGDETLDRVFRPTGLKDVSDLQAVLDAVERTLLTDKEARDG